MDPIISEAILRSLRTVTVITGVLVWIDSVGIMLSVEESPPHKPRWSAAAWAIISGVAAIVSSFLIANRIGLVSPNGTNLQKASIWLLYSGLIVGFTLRAVSRAHRPLRTIFAVVGMTIAGVLFALKDITG